MVLKPQMRSQFRALTLWGIAEEPTWPGWNPSVSSPAPAISRSVVAALAAAAATWWRAVTTSKSRLRG